MVSLGGSGQCWKTVASGRNHTKAIKLDGTLWATGYNATGNLGDSTYIPKFGFVKVGNDSNWKEVSIGIGDPQLH